MTASSTIFRRAALLLFCALLTIGQSVRADDYRIAAEDVIGVTVANHPEYSLDPITVGTTGTITLPTLGEVAVVGKTLEQIRQDVTQKLKYWLKKPVVTVGLRQQRAERISVSGAVNSVGFFPIKPGWRVSEAITAAGGLKDLPENVRATLTRGSTAPVDLNIAEVLANPQSASNLALKAEDRLEITLIPPTKITVSGDVLRPDQYDFKKAPRVIDALTLAGWLKQKAASSKAFILRRGQKLDVNLVEAVDNKNDAANTALQADDVLLVEAIPPSTIYVSGLVAKPGPYQLEPGNGVLETITQAGGLATSTDKIAATVRRGLQNIPLDLTRIAFDPAANLPLQNNDVLLLNEPETIRVQVSGSVAKPGLVALKPNSRLLDAIAEAGGITIKSEEARINILRDGPGGKQTVLSVDPVGLLGFDDLAQNAPLRDRDFIAVVPIKTEMVSLTGEVERPGEYVLQPTDGLAEVLARAGSYKDSAALRGIIVTKRNGGAKVYDLTKLRNGEKVNVPLEPGDFISVPSNNARVMVMEAVNRPGPVNIPETQPLTLGLAFAAAGGPKEKARTKQIYILRKVNDQVQKQQVALDGIYNGAPATEMPLQNGDVIFVPGFKTSFLSNLISNPLALVSSLRIFGF